MYFNLFYSEVVVYFSLFFSLFYSAFFSLFYSAFLWLWCTMHVIVHG